MKKNQPKVESKPRSDKMSLHFVLPMILFYLVAGILLIWLESLVTTVMTYALGILLAAGGVWFLVCYFKSEIAVRLAGKDMAIGLILLLAGILLLFSPNFLEDVLPSVWGLSLIFGGFLKIQYAFDEKSVRVKRWWIMLIFAAVSLIIGVLAFLRPSFFGNNQHVIIGIFLLGEAVLDLVTYILLSRGMKREAATLPKHAAPDPAPVPEALPEAPAPAEAPSDPAPETEAPASEAPEAEE